MSRIETGGVVPEFLQQAGADGFNLVRQILRYNRSVEGITYGLFDSEQRQAAKTLALTTESFGNKYFPGFTDLNGESLIQGTTDWLIEEAERQKERDFSGREAWLQYYGENFPSMCQDRAKVILDYLNLPEQVLELKPESSNAEISRVIGVPEKVAGLKFLPGYRILEWEGGAEEGLKLVLSKDMVEGKIWLEKEDGRRFFIGSTGGTVELEKLLSEEENRIVISEIEFEGELPKIETVLFDIDDTLRTSASERGVCYENTSEEGVEARIRAIKDVGERGIKVGLWSRNWHKDVESFGKRLTQETGVEIGPCISLNTWPFLVANPSSSLDRFKPNDLETIREIIQSNSQKMGVNIDVDVWAEKISQLLAGVNDNLRMYSVLEAKAPCMAALWLGRKDLWDGVIVNDARLTLASALNFGFSFIDVDRVENVDQVSRLVFNS